VCAKLCIHLLLFSMCQRQHSHEIVLHMQGKFWPRAYCSQLLQSCIILSCAACRTANAQKPERASLGAVVVTQRACGWCRSLHLHCCSNGKSCPEDWSVHFWQSLLHHCCVWPLERVCPQLLHLLPINVVLRQSQARRLIKGC
jgi:hypothetical protein